MTHALWSEFDRLIAGACHDPHALLGRHPAGQSDEDGCVLRTLRRRDETPARNVVALVDGERYPMAAVHPQGVFEARLAQSLDQIEHYQVEVDGVVCEEPYSFPPSLGELDLALISAGRHEQLWRVLGAVARPHGVSFAVWAPSAVGVRLVGDFTGWGVHDGWPMRSMGSSGVWELTAPDALPGQRYKFRILTQDGSWVEKADPLAGSAEVPPRTASVVFQSGHVWGDQSWLRDRGRRPPHEAPISIYEVHLGSWRPGLSYDELAVALTEYVTQLGFTHVELMPVMEHPFGGSWGYQVSGYYAPTGRFGDPDGLRRLIDALHQAGIGVILDWVPAHFPRDEFALARFDGTALYEHPDPRRGEHPDWGTLIFNYGRNEVRNFLIANALYWFEEFHIDGLRVDAVASMLYLDYSREDGQWEPNALGGRENLDAVTFLQELNATVYRLHPDAMMIAEESTAWSGVTRPTDSGGLGFGLKWNMGWMHDTLGYVNREPIHRQWHHHELTFAAVYAWSENYVLPISHDEVVHGKGSLSAKIPGDLWQRTATVRALLAFMWAFPGKQLLFMGAELADDREWSADRGLDWALRLDPQRAGIATLLAQLNREYRASPQLWSSDCQPDGFAWITADDVSRNVFAFQRSTARGYRAENGGGRRADAAGPGGSDLLVCVVNFAAVPHTDYRLGLPRAGSWREVVNTDAAGYGGSDVGNLGLVRTDPIPWHGHTCSAKLVLPPLGALWLRPESTVESFNAGTDSAEVREYIDADAVRH